MFLFFQLNLKYVKQDFMRIKKKLVGLTRLNFLACHCFQRF